MKLTHAIAYIKKKTLKQFFKALISYLHGWFKKKTGYMFYKKSFIKYKVYSSLLHDINLPEANPKELEILRFASELSISRDNAWSMIQAVSHIHYSNIEGDFVECGVYEGRMLILLKELQENFKLNNKIYGYDTFEGMTESSEMDTYTEKKLNNLKASGNLGLSMKYASIDHVKQNLQKNHIDISNINLIKGDVMRTLNSEQNLPKKISLLRLDTDYYESTLKELEVLYPRLESKGVLIIDDYGFFDGCRKAVDEYFKDKYVIKHYVDKNIRLIIKE